MPAAPAVETRELVKVFERGRRTIWQRLRREPDRRERFRAVDGIDLTVRSGEIFGLLGPNGAGKTTTMKMLATLLIPTSGSIRVLGIDPLERPRDAVRLSDRADDYVERYSTGMRQRLALARALLPDPPLLLRDEPTVGLDPQAARDLRDRVRELKRAGRTVLLTTHYMEEADQLCDRVAIIDHGRIVALDAPAALKRTIRAEEVVRLEVGVDGDDASLLDRIGARARVARRERENGTLNLTVHCDSARDFVPAAFDIARGTGAVIRHVEVVPVTLEDVFLSLTGRALRE